MTRLPIAPQTRGVVPPMSREEEAGLLAIADERWRKPRNPPPVERGPEPIVAVQLFETGGLILYMHPDLPNKHRADLIRQLVERLKEQLDLLT